MQFTWYNSLRVQILLLLTLALFPLGSVAIFQTNQVATEAERNGELALLALTERAAKSERLVIEGAFVAARFLAENAQEMLENPQTCSAELRRFVAGNPSYSFAGLLPISGMMTCASNGRSFDFSDYPNFEDTMAARAPTITVNASAPMSEQSVFIVSYPYQIDDRFAGFVSVSIPHDNMENDVEALLDLGLLDLVTFNPSGLVLTTRTEQENVMQLLPSSRDLASLSKIESIAFKDTTVTGDRHTFTVVKIQGTPASVMAIWDAEDGLNRVVNNLILPALFPVLMWFASITVAMMSVYTLVTRHLTRLQQAMDDFADSRANVIAPHSGPMPNELRALQDNFVAMTTELMQDEARLEDALREKNVLIKEVHHRVKNNLQLISSIMSMQIRNAEHAETKSVIARLQDRVLSLATIHRDLYQSQHGGMVNVGELISEVVEKTVELAESDQNPPKVETDIDPILLYPDQAVPLSLMMSEAMTNALKYIGAPDGQQPWITASLKQTGQHCVLTLANSVGEQQDVESTGLGSQLINAFAIQLSGEVTLDPRPNVYTMTISFDVKDFTPEHRDY